jgi:hypothetical protein
MIEHILHRKDNQFNGGSWKAFTNKLSQLPDGKFLVKVENISKRSNQQNRYIHAVLIPEFGKALHQQGHEHLNDPAIAKKVMKEIFLKTEVDGLPFTKDTSDLTKAEMSVLIEEVIKFCADNLNYQIAYPNEQLTMQIDEP